MRERAAEYPIAERPAQMGDLLVAELSALVDIRPEAAEARPTMIEIGADNIPGFDEQLIGISKGEEKTFASHLPRRLPRCRPRRRGGRVHDLGQRDPREADPRA